MRQNRNVFHIPLMVILLTSVTMGVLASIPKILQLHIGFGELAVDATIAFLYTFIIFYLNLYRLPAYSTDFFIKRLLGWRLLGSLFVGIVLMIALVLIHQFIFPKYKLGSMMLMYQFRGILISLTIYMFLQVLYKTHHVQNISMELERSRAAHTNLRFDLLKQQINPHFLFNSLNTLKSMIEIQDANSVKFVVSLSAFYRSTLENQDTHVIPVRDELEILGNYLFLLEARFEEGLHVEVSLPGEYMNSLIPAFTLQLLIENAVKHNVISLDMPLKVWISGENGFIDVKNLIHPKNYSETSTHTGLKNINERYLYINSRTITIEKTDKYFTVKLPLIDGHIDH
ncbi:LytS/YehU family sensor histidine kinase [Pedobacter sp. AK017]|uniref:sensor histidine kinase n=1 Tax=Pedobacter sp. AK017 TaxID=2723073 RepID=UPI0016157178|nr:histidine kinase [Pedobacter sp. AK017]MBB5440464.1 LytS/YehU family sensor histidine kinase [Pedobacter sp. AK017]